MHPNEKNKIFKYQGFLGEKVLWKEKKKSGYNTRTMVTNGDDNDFLPGTC